jgi:hypothetical protein
VNKKAPVGYTGAEMDWAGLCLGHFAGLDGLNRDPHTLHFAAGELDAKRCTFGRKRRLVFLTKLGADTTALFGETFTDNATAFDGALCQ